jgi:hypothetical protein
MQKYKLLNNIFGWLMFFFAAVVYTLTMETSGSFWDCGEFISGCYRLQVVHPPGAPFFLMLGRLFTLLGGEDGSRIAMMVNWMSALATAGAVMFTFWTTTALAKKFLMRDNNYTDGKIFTVIGAGLIAATSCTFLDSLWFSAVEGEVYALSQFFMSIIVWMIMKWDADDSPYADHWIVLIAYMTGLSIGVHLLSLLAIPAIAVVYYYKRFKTTLIGWIGAVAVGFFVLGFYMKFIISFTQSYLAGMDMFFVNSLGLGFNSGIIAGVVLLILVFALILRYTHSGKDNDFYLAIGAVTFYVLLGFIINDSWASRFARIVFIGGLLLARNYGYEARRILNVAVLAMLFSYIGYLSYIMVPVRAIANPPINMNRPTDPFTIKSYVDREQYGDRPLAKGPDYTASYDDIIGYKTTGKRWVKNVKTNRYEDGGDKQDYEFSPESQMLFPRLGFWQEDQKKAGYRAWLNPEFNIIDRDTREVLKTFPPDGQKTANEYVAQLNKDNPGRDGRGKYAVKDAISFSDNIAYFFKYQVGYMYLRYFMWNFSGRQDDIQGTYGNDNGRWISGISFIDNSFIAKNLFAPAWPQENLPKEALANKARNKFFMIPLMIGLLGLIYTYFKDEETFLVILVLFGTTGLLQIVYQNEPPIEPRERDYAQAGSFLTYTIWMGFGVVALFDIFRTRLKLAELPSSFAALALCVAAPVLMGSQGWDDHNRHGRNTARDFARCYLESCAPNAIIFTQGDNDTYPLWYAQETEHIRTDIRIINLSLLGVDWYIDQLRYKMNDAPAVQLSFRSDQYAGSNRDVTRYRPVQGISSATPVELKQMMSFIASDDPNSKDKESGDSYYFSKTFFIDIDTNLVRQKNFVSKDEDSLIVPRMQWTIENSALLKNDLMTLDIVANNLMTRPIYFAVSVAPDAYVGLEKYFQLEGLTYRIVPKENVSGSPYSAPARTDVMYDNMMKKFRFGGIESNPDIYLDENNLRMTVNLKGNFGRLAEALLAKGEKQKAAEVIDHSLKNLPSDRVPHSVFDFQYPGIYYEAGQKEKGRKLMEEMLEKCKDELNYYKTVYNYDLQNAMDNGNLSYYNQLQQGEFMNRREVREQLYIMQEMNMAAKKYEDAAFAQKVEKDFNDYRMSFVRMPQQPDAGAPR